MAESWQGIFF